MVELVSSVVTYANYVGTSRSYGPGIRKLQDQLLQREMLALSI